MLGQISEDKRDSPIMLKTEERATSLFEKKKDKMILFNVLEKSYLIRKSIKVCSGGFFFFSYQMLTVTQRYVTVLPRNHKRLGPQIENKQDLAILPLGSPHKHCAIRRIDMDIHL